VLHENTKLHDYFQERDSIDATAAGAAVESASNADHAIVKLPDVAAERSVPIEDAILRRRSRRRFGTAGMTWRDIAAILYFTAGVTGWARTATGERTPLRAAPSGGALYPISIYVYPRHVAELAPALYRYDPLSHALVECGVPAEQCEQISAHSAHCQVLNQAAAVFVLAGSFERSQRKYLERGYRLILLEAGHIAQNLQLIATARQLSTCGVAGFVDDIVNETLGLTRHGSAQALYLLAVGPPQQPQREHGARPGLDT
jgi:SagB-type dehydrogenase family enzyme